MNKINMCKTMGKIRQDGSSLNLSTMFVFIKLILIRKVNISLHHIIATEVVCIKKFIHLLIDSCLEVSFHLNVKFTCNF